jgi:hypothetical protein
MTRGEFNKWWTHFATAFPAAKDHVLKDGKGGEAALTLWFGVLSKRDIGDALAVTLGLFEGTMPELPGKNGFTDWSAVPRHVSRLCGELHPIEPEWKQHTVRSRAKVGIIEGDPSMAEAFARCLEIQQDYPPRSAEGKAAVSAFLDEFYGHKQSPAAARDKGNYEPAFDAFNQS